MTRAEATARVVEWAREILRWGTIGEHAARQRELRDTLAALDASPPADTIDVLTPYTTNSGSAGRAPQAGPAPAQGVAPVPEWKTPENLAAARRLATYGTSDVWQADVMRRLAALETAVGNHECAGPSELIDSARLDALAAQVGRVERAVRRLAEGQWHASNIAGNTETETKAIIDDGGPDGSA